MRLKECFDKRLLTRIPKNPDIIAKAVKMAEEDLVEAERSYTDGRYAWATVQAYTSILNMARAVLFNDGIKERSHVCTVQYLRSRFSKHFGELIDKMDILRRERHTTLYDSRSHITEEKVKERIQWSREFMMKAKELMEKE
jgi:uncharacterized protein (UPF0332 family)